MWADMKKRTKGKKKAPVEQAVTPEPIKGGRDNIVLIVVAAAPALFLWRAALLRGIFLHSDICYFFEPVKAFMHEALQLRRLPLWTPYLFCGYPMASEGQIATFYPPAILISWLLPSFAAINWLLISHLMLAGVGVYLLSRNLNISRYGAWLAAFVFSFSGYLYAHLQHISLICAAAWLPFVLLFIERFWREKFVYNAVFAAIAWAASALCGHPQTTFHITLAALFWIAWHALQAQKARPREVLIHSIKLVVILFGLGFGLSAVQLLLTSELAATAPHGDRGSLLYVTSFSLLPKHLLGLLAPNWQGTIAFGTYRGEPYYWEYVLYLGLIPLSLALIGASRRRGWALAGFALGALVLALAMGNPIYEALRFIPGFRDFRVPARYVFLFTFAMAMLAGLGWDSIISWRWFAGKRATTLGALVTVLTIFDLVWFDKTMTPLADTNVVKTRPRVVELLRADENWGRSFILPPITFKADWSPPGGWAVNPNGWAEARNYLPASVPQSFDLRTVGGYAAFVDPRHSLFFQEANVQASQGKYDLYSLVGAQYFVVSSQLELSGLPATEAGPFKVYKNEVAFPRAFVIGEAVKASNDMEALNLTFQLASTGGLKTTCVTRGTEFDIKGDATGIIERIIESRPERVIVYAKAKRAAVVVLNERWDRGWEVRVDGRPAPLLEVDSVLMGAPISSGEHKVEFHYHPRGLVVGRAISAFSLALCLALFIISRRSKQR